ncbi:hypothetical protein TSMEX_011366 [Taenia solium]|eukprot:TsM_000099300 transcript=TsM_000099300 gene=TsM_000099300
MNRIQSKLVEAASVLPQLLDHSSFQNVFNLAHGFTNIGFYLLEGMRHQHEKPTPSLIDVRTQDLDYETDIDADRELMSPRVFPPYSLQHVRKSGG